ncbi:MAG: ferrous iron transport protein [Thermotogaceae bacterium]|nr:ferrous iron transport protein [Thermotogaceae bacterium]MDN5338167.1 ferrous iron transport protein [Thermotogaceae bacterium]
MKIDVAICGNPNVGKTSLFNALTGSRQRVGNWPGVTVAKKEGYRYWKGHELKFVDLPGTYTLGAQSLDEKIARDAIVNGDEDIVVVISDALSLERGLYLLFQVLEATSKPVIFVINAIDEARKAGIVIDKTGLEVSLNIPVVLTSALTEEGVDELCDKILEVYSKPSIDQRKFILKYNEEIEQAIQKIERELEKEKEFDSYNKRWIAIKTLEGDSEVLQLITKSIPHLEIPEDIQIEISSDRYQLVSNLLKNFVSESSYDVWNISDAIDHVFTHKYIGIPIFLAILYMMFKITFDIAAPLSDSVAAFFDWLANITSSISPRWLASLLSDGIIGGVGSILVFVPNIFILFFMMGFLEETGYFSRAAFVVDRFMYYLKISGRSFISFILGFGCSVPAIMSTRVMGDPRERLVTLLSVPFISCSARLPVYILIAGALFKNPGNALFGIYFFSIIVTTVSILILNKLFFKGTPSPFIIEMPRYRMPVVKNLVIYMWNNGKHFLQKAGTIILVSAIVIWFLSYFPAGNVENSYAALLGKLIQPVFKVHQFDWRITTSLIFGISAKEVVVSSYATLVGSQEDSPDLVETLRNSLNPVNAFALMVFVMAYVPCFATLATIKSETGSLKYMLFSIVYTILIAYILSLIVVVVGRALIA